MTGGNRSGAQGESRKGRGNRRSGAAAKTVAPARVPADSEPSPQRQHAARFGDVLLRRQKESGQRRKGQRTRDRLKVAAIAVLDDQGFRNLRVSDVCKRAKVSSAAFYLYFKNKTEITAEVLTGFLEWLIQMPMPGERRSRTVYQAIYEINLAWILAVRANSGLMRCLLQLSDETPEFKALYERMSHDWYLHVAHGLTSRFPEARLDEKVALLATYALGGLIDEISRCLLVERQPYLHDLVGELAPTDEALAEFLALLWYRAMFAAEPVEVRSRAARELQRIARVDHRRLDDGKPTGEDR